MKLTFCTAKSMMVMGANGGTGYGCNGKTKVR